LGGENGEEQAVRAGKSTLQKTGLVRGAEWLQREGNGTSGGKKSGGFRTKTTAPRDVKGLARIDGRPWAPAKGSGLPFGEGRKKERKRKIKTPSKGSLRRFYHRKHTALWPGHGNNSVRSAGKWAVSDSTVVTTLGQFFLGVYAVPGGNEWLAREHLYILAVGKCCSEISSTHKKERQTLTKKR